MRAILELFQSSSCISCIYCINRRTFINGGKAEFLSLANCCRCEQTLTLPQQENFLLVTNLTSCYAVVFSGSKHGCSADTRRQTNINSRVTTWNKLLAEGLSYCSIPTGGSASPHRLETGCWAFWKMFGPNWRTINYLRQEIDIKEQ